MRAMAKKSLLKNSEGAAALEFALVFPVMIFFVMAIIEFGLIMHVNTLVDNATHEGARLGTTGNTYADLNATGLERKEFIDSYIRDQLGNWVRSSDQLNVTTKIIGANIGAVGNNLTTVGHQGFGSGGEAVVYNVQYKWQILTPIMANIIGEDGNFLMTATAVVKNENFR
jgi:Flp pilus assembly protein TadG